MAFLICMLILAVVSVIWAFYSLRKERQRHEIDKAKEDIATGRVIFHSSEVSESESS
jgi:hypothetical protein